MATESVLDASAHAKTFVDEVLPNSRLNHTTAQAHPRAIVLAGQPGAGKGGLVEAAQIQFFDNVVIVDPDALRNYHPQAKALRDAHPYTWSGDTHPDASQWAKELRDVAIEGRRNLIVDTTLSDGDKAVTLVRQLQNEGYAVEVRAIATHRLESELGIDQRFTDKIDLNGYGRHVPTDYHAKVYDALPGNLDQVRAQTTAPVQIYDREGKLHYDSRVDSKMPGAVLDDVRDTRLSSIRRSWTLQENLHQQVEWHQQLPEHLRANPNVSAQARLMLPQQNSELQIVESVSRGAREAETAVVRNVAVKGLHTLGTAAIAYDAATTLHRVGELGETGNVTGMQSEVLHFGGRTVGILGGAKLGAMAGAALGSETGPGVALTGTAGALVGGVMGGVAAEKMTEVIDRALIYTQRDPDGHPWLHDPHRPELGWTRATHTLDPDASRLNDGVPVYTTHTLTADARLTKRLNYQASSTAVDMALAQPAVPRDPYSQPAGVQDAASVREAPWQRDPQTHEWRREIVNQVLEHGLVSAYSVTASPMRTAQLEQAAQQTIVDNLARTPQAVAAQFQHAYEQHGWKAYGPIPESVAHALKIPDHVLPASDGHTYTQGSDGQWRTPGLIYGSNTPSDRVREELNASDALQRTQAAQRQPEPPVEQATTVASFLHLSPELDDNAIRTLQNQLRVQGFHDHYGRPLSETGVYDMPTRCAIATLQYETGLPETGLPDKATLSFAEAYAKLAVLQKQQAAGLDQPTADFKSIRVDANAQHAPSPAEQTSKHGESQASALRPFSDPGHPQHALYSELKRALPDYTSERCLAQFTAACHQGNLKAGQIDAIEVKDQKAQFYGLAGYAKVDMEHRPSIEQSLQQVATFNEQREQQRVTQEQQQQQSGPVLTRKLH